MGFIRLTATESEMTDVGCLFAGTDCATESGMTDVGCLFAGIDCAARKFDDFELAICSDPVKGILSNRIHQHGLNSPTKTDLTRKDQLNAPIKTEFTNKNRNHQGLQP